MSFLPPLSAFLLAGAPAAPVNSLVSSFTQACVDGQVSKEVLEELTFDRLPMDLRAYAGDWKSGRHFRIRSLPDTYLFLLDDGGKMNPGLTNLCAIVGVQFSARKAFEETVKVLGGPTPPPPERGQFGFSQVNFEHGYFLFVGGLVTRGWGGPFASRYQMIRIGQMKPQFASQLRQQLSERRAKSDPDSKQQED